jgi:hypothetical protein
VEHLSQSDFDAIVMGTAPADDRVRAHLRDCGLCMERLAREARREEALYDSVLNADRSEAHVARPASVHVLWPAAAALAVVAAGILFVSSQPRRVSPAPPVTDATATPSTAPHTSSTDAPGLLDPLSFAPGYAVTSPAEYCLRTTAPAEIGPHR